MARMKLLLFNRRQQIQAQIEELKAELETIDGKLIPMIDARDNHSLTTSDAKYIVVTVPKYVFPKSVTLAEAEVSALKADAIAKGKAKKISESKHIRVYRL